MDSSQHDIGDYHKKICPLQYPYKRVIRYCCHKMCNQFVINYGKNYLNAVLCKRSYTESAEKSNNVYNFIKRLKNDTEVSFVLKPLSRMRIFFFQQKKL